MTKKSYAEKLRDPRWQKLRLKLLEAAGFKCNMCCDEKSTLHVHHKWYKRDTDSWDYPEDAFTVLCEQCHDIAQYEMEEAHQILGNAGAFYHWLMEAVAVLGEPRIVSLLRDVLLAIVSAQDSGLATGYKASKKT